MDADILLMQIKTFALILNQYLQNQFLSNLVLIESVLFVDTYGKQFERLSKVLQAI